MTQTLSLWLIKRPDGDQGYDQNYGHVIAAYHPSEARRLAADGSSDEGPEIWLSPERTTTTLLAMSCQLKAPAIVLTDHLAG